MAIKQSTLSMYRCGVIINPNGVEHLLCCAQIFLAKCTRRTTNISTRLWQSLDNSLALEVVSLM